MTAALLTFTLLTFCVGSLAIEEGQAVGRRVVRTNNVASIASFKDLDASTTGQGHGVDISHDGYAMVKISRTPGSPPITPAMASLIHSDVCRVVGDCATVHIQLSPSVIVLHMPTASADVLNRLLTQHKLSELGGQSGLVIAISTPQHGTVHTLVVPQPPPPLTHIVTHSHIIAPVYMARPRPTETDDSHATYKLTNDQWPLAWLLLFGIALLLATVYLAHTWRSRRVDPPKPARTVPTTTATAPLLTCTQPNLLYRDSEPMP